MKARHKRFGLIAVGLILLVIATVLITKSFRSNLVFFFSPTQVEKGEAPKTGSFRIGGLVENGSLKRMPDGLHVQFKVTDTAKSIPVQYKGILPDLFKEGKGVVAEGKLNENGLFEASQVLAKHDENYMPPEAAAAIEAANAAKTKESVK
ncbi:MAG TPA: cytochrome c maturation protein CcmE [Methylotenera sp.]|nr:cytochrome c maturation protein CcmE [Methylotenera sp.]HPV44333.1 cytochrome c maturation protein CcmE [Methylotenera sp.]